MAGETARCTELIQGNDWHRPFGEMGLYGGVAGGVQKGLEPDMGAYEILFAGWREGVGGAEDGRRWRNHRLRKRGHLLERGYAVCV